MAGRMQKQILGETSAAQRPLIIAPAALCTRRGRDLIASLKMIRAPVIAMESPRGINDPVLGCYAEVLAAADLIVLLGKPLDFTLRFGRSRRRSIRSAG